MFPIAADERLRWHYVPQPRPGIAFKELTDTQRALAFGQLGTALSRPGRPRLHLGGRRRGRREPRPHRLARARPGRRRLRRRSARQHHAEAHAAADTPATRRWRTELGRPIDPFRIVGNIYYVYVGANNIASYLITTSQGPILLDTGTREMLPMVQSSIVKLGFRLQDFKIL